jgi:hypothetical protein
MLGQGLEELDIATGRVSQRPLVAAFDDIAKQAGGFNFGPLTLR